LAFGAAALGLGQAACSRDVPASFPRGSAASLDASGAPAAEVGVVLAEDPPLPGEPAARWPRLDEAGARSGGDHQHHHHAAPDGGVDGGHVH
jgi:hypothetical protein